IQQKYNEEHGIVPKTIIKEIRDLISITKESEDDTKEAVQVSYEEMTKEEKDTLLMKLEKEMKDAAKALDFETAANVRDMILELKASK
ncbi:UvrB/UvrC motif-containing protein, partial [Enterococcus faecium]